MKSLLFKVSSLLLCLNVFAGNSIYITQVGTSDNLTLDILQDGDDNEVRLSVSHDNNTIDIDQEGDDNTISWVSYWGSGQNWGGDLDGSNNTLKFEQFNTTGTDANVIGFHIPTSDNTIHVCQGKTFDNADDTTCTSTTSSEYGGHTANIDIHGGSTTLRGSQETGTGNADHYARVYTWNGTGNDIFFKQSGNGDKWLQLIVRTHNGEQEVIQAGNGEHTATIDLTGSYTTDLSLTQNSSSDKTYTLTNNCQTSSGCSVTVTQN